MTIPAGYRPWQILFARHKTEKMGKTLIIFDVDGTLVYSNRIDSQCFAETYERLYLRTFPTIDWTQYPHVTDTTIFNTVIRRHFNRDVTQEELDEFQHHYIYQLEQKRALNPNEFKEVPFAKKTLDSLKMDDRFVVGIATGGWLRPAQVKLRHVEIQEQTIFMSGADGKETREDIIYHVIGEVRQHVEALDKIVYVGDAIWDVATTRRMQLNFVGVRRNGDLEVLQRAGSKIVIRDYTDYDQFLEAVFTATPPLNPEEKEAPGY